MNTARLLEEKIHRSIPISAEMGFHIAELSDERILIKAPLESNINIHGTGFAGSIYSLGMLSAWALVTHLIMQQDIEAELVIARAEIKYSAPIKHEIQCRCELTESQGVKFIAELQNRKRARLNVDVVVGDSAEAILNVVLYAKIKS